MCTCCPSCMQMTAMLGNVHDFHCSTLWGSSTCWYSYQNVSVVVFEGLFYKQSHQPIHDSSIPLQNVFFIKHFWVIFLHEKYPRRRSVLVRGLCCNPHGLGIKPFDPFFFSYHLVTVMVTSNKFINEYILKNHISILAFRRKWSLNSCIIFKGSFYLAIIFI